MGTAGGPERGDRLSQVLLLFLRGASEREIAHRLGLRPTQVARCTARLREEWEAAGEGDASQGLALAKVGYLELLSWEAWDRSRLGAETVKVVSSGNAKRVEKTIRDKIGNARFLSQVAWCIRTRCALLGIPVPAAGGDGSSTPLTEAELQEQAAQRGLCSPRWGRELFPEGEGAAVEDAGDGL